MAIFLSQQSPWPFRWFGNSAQLIEITFLAAADEAFGITLEFVPRVADFRCLLRTDGVVERRGRDHAKHLRKLADDFMGGRQNLEALFARTFRIAKETTAGLLAEPFDNGFILAEFHQGGDAVQGIAASRAVDVWFFRPFVDERQGNAQLRGNRFGTHLFKHLAQNFVTFHADRISSFASKDKVISHRENHLMIMVRFFERVFSMLHPHTNRLCENPMVGNRVRVRERQGSGSSRRKRDC